MEAKTNTITMGDLCRPDAERGVVAWILTEPGWYETYDFLRPEDFTVPYCRRIWKAILDVRAEYPLPSWEEMAGLCPQLADEISELVMELPEPPEGHHVGAHMVADLSFRRQVAEKLEELVKSKHMPMQAVDVGEQVSAELMGIVRKHRLRWGDSQRFTMKDLLLEYLGEYDQHEKTDMEEFRTGMQVLDLTLHVRRGSLTILAGRPSSGKSSFSRQWSWDVATSGGRVYYYQLEEDAKTFRTKMLSTAYGIRSSRIDGKNLPQEELDQLVQAQYTVPDSFVSIFDTHITPTDIKQTLDREPSDMVVIDYLGLMNLPKGDNKHLQISAAVRDIKLMAKDSNTAIVLLCQLNRSVGEGDPKLYHLRDSGGIEEHADNVLFVHSPEGNRNQIRRLIVAKQRSGATGEFETAFNGELGVFADVVKV